MVIVAQECEENRKIRPNTHKSDFLVSYYRVGFPIIEDTFVFLSFRV